MIANLFSIFSAVSTLVAYLAIPSAIFTRMDLISVFVIISIVIIIISIGITILSSLNFKKRIFISILVILLFVVGGVWFLANQTSVTITDPNDGNTVKSSVDVKGFAKNIPEGDKIWLVIVSPTGMYYPQSPSITPDIRTGYWQLKDVNIGSPIDSGKRFYMITILANNDSQKHLDNYLKESARNGSWSGLETLPPGTKVYSKIAIIRA